MNPPISRRNALRQLGAAGAGIALAGGVLRARAAPMTVAGRPVEVVIS
jgi:hypothetical protein